MLSDKGELPGCTYGIESSAALQFLRCFTSPKNQLISPLLEMKKNQKTRKTTIKHNAHRQISKILGKKSVAFLSNQNENKNHTIIINSA